MYANRTAVFCRGQHWRLTDAGSLIERRDRAVNSGGPEETWLEKRAVGWRLLPRPQTLPSSDSTHCCQAWSQDLKSSSCSSSSNAGILFGRLSLSKEYLERKHRFAGRPARATQAAQERYISPDDGDALSFIIIYSAEFCSRP